VEHFCERFCAAHEMPRIEPSAGALRAAEEAEWPGNVRELAHAVQAAVVRAAGEGVLRVERRHLFPDEALDPRGGGAPAPMTFQQATRRFQAELLKRTLDEASWNVTETATRLDLTRQHVYNMIRAFGLERPP
jgi:Nif-specific regulatory protein